MARYCSLFFIVCAFFAKEFIARAAVVEHTFNVGSVTLSRLCQNTVITAVNGQLPGPVIRAHEGDNVVVHVVNGSPYPITIHWHGIFQQLSGWMDGPNRITQCPIIPGGKFTYNFTITGQEGTLWWHAHVTMLRATVYGALIIRPRTGADGYPFSKPYKEATILLGQWWRESVADVQSAAQATGLPPNNSDAYTINGRAGDLYPCSAQHTYRLEVERGKTYMLRIINAALESQLFFKVAGHSLTVVAADAAYTSPYTTDVLVLAPGHTVDALMTADAAPGLYYMAAHSYASGSGPFDNTTTTGIVSYKSFNGTAVAPAMPALPAFNDTPAAHRFYTGMTALNRPGARTVPVRVTNRMFVTSGLGLTPCEPDQPACQQVAFAASMNNVSFRFPLGTSMLEARYRGLEGVYTPDFPDSPPVVFDYTDSSLSANPAMMFTSKGTKVKRLRYNATVEMVLQDTALVGAENHPLHLHGLNFFVVAQGFGNHREGAVRYNLVNPQERNTIAVPVGGWAVIRFRADNPGVWLMHCHLDSHLVAGLAVAFEVEDGPTAASTLPPPPPDYPRC